MYVGYYYFPKESTWSTAAHLCGTLFHPGPQGVAVPPLFGPETPTRMFGGSCRVATAASSRMHRQLLH